MGDNRPIGVFDSGVGGLTVLRALERRVPAESIIYFGDLARCPYGPRPQPEVREFALQIGDHLARMDIKLLVVACNTATAAAFPDLRDRLPIPVIGVVEPGARAAIERTRGGAIGVIATIGTIQSGAYRAALEALVPEVRIVERSASWLVPLIERGPFTRPEACRRLRPTLEEMRVAGVDTLILGCTHFPLVADLFAGIGAGVAVVDSADTTAREVEETLRALGSTAAGPAWRRWLVTGPAEAFAERAQAMFRASPPIETVALGALEPGTGANRSRW